MRPLTSIARPGASALGQENGLVPTAHPNPPQYPTLPATHPRENRGPSGFQERALITRAALLPNPGFLPEILPEDSISRRIRAVSEWAAAAICCPLGGACGSLFRPVYLHRGTPGGDLARQLIFCLRALQCWRKRARNAFLPEGRMSRKASPLELRCCGEAALGGEREAPRKPPVPRPTTSVRLGPERSASWLSIPQTLR